MSFEYIWTRLNVNPTVHKLSFIFWLVSWSSSCKWSAGLTMHYYHYQHHYHQHQHQQRAGGVMVSMLGSQPRCSGVWIPGWVKTKWVCLLKRCNPCLPSSKIGTGVSRGFVTLQSQQEWKAGNPTLLCVCVCVCVLVWMICVLCTKTGALCIIKKINKTPPPCSSSESCL